MSVEAIKKTPLPPVVSSYGCYRILIKDYYEYKKSLWKSFSYRKFSQKSGFGSPNYIQQVIAGNKSICTNSGERIAQALGMTKLEAQFFTGLILKDNAKSSKAKEEAEKWILASARRLASKDICSAQTEVFKTWYHLLIREMVLLKDFQPDVDYIFNKLGGRLDRAKIEESLQFLIKSGFLLKEGDRLIVSDPVIDSGDNIFTHDLMQTYHKSVLTMWAKNIKELDREYQELGLLNIPLKKSQISELKKKIREFQDEIIGLVQDEKEADIVVQLGTYLLPV